MQLVMMSSLSSSSSSSQSAGGRPDQIKGVEEFQRLHPHSSPPPPPPPGPHREAMKKHHHRHGHHGDHSPPRHHHGHFSHKLHHDSFPTLPPVCALHCKKDKLRFKHPKHCKKVGKLHRKLMKACKPPKGTAHHLHMHNVCPGARQLASPFNPADVPHHPGCCLHNRHLSMMQADMLAELEQQPPSHKAGVGHHAGGHLRHLHPHRHGRHGPHVRSEIKPDSVPAMLPARHEAKDMQAEPTLEAGVLPPVSDNVLLADEGGPAAVI